jgi:fibro-slime domain-containing protein
MSLLAASQALGQTPDTVKLDGVIRDFKEWHPDFNVVLPDGPGHYAGNIDLLLGDADRPIFREGGFKVTSEWLNLSGRPIAPHLYRNPSGATLRLENPPTLSTGVVMDSWDPDMGPYGGANVGPAPSMEIGATMPTVTVPGGFGPSVGPVELSGAGTLSADIHCDSFVTDAGTEIFIDGNVAILCDGTFELNQASSIKLLPGAKLTLYILGDNASINQGSTVNMNTWTPSRCEIYFLGAGIFEISQNCQVCARIAAPNGTVEFHQNDHLYGSLVAANAVFDQTTGYHAEDGTPAQDACGVDILDFVGAAGAVSDAGISSAASFDQWYQDLLGVNVAGRHAITLFRDPVSGVYQYLDDAFYPIDGRLYGNDGDEHNNYFTYTIDAEFAYSACGDQFLEFAGSDDAWIFVDGKLGIDLGGIMPGTDQVLEMDRLGLTDGETYKIQLFYAHRDPTEASFNLTTNIVLLTEKVHLTASLPCD